VSALLEVTGLAAGYGQSRVLFDLAFAIHPGEVVTLLGRNGMGKTTTVKAIAGLLRPTAGQIRFAGRDVTGRPAHEVARLGLGLVPEGRQIFPNLTVRENLVATAANRSGSADPWTFDKVVDLFPGVGRRLSNMGNQLSGGEQQMLAVGRALMTNPLLLVLDEATEGLAPLIRDEIWGCLARLKAAGQAILVIDKNVQALTRVADRHHIVEKGRIVWTGASVDLAADPDLQQRFLGV
jgi:branched-chain amino acid transport system ATP-binding protein